MDQSQVIESAFLRRSTNNGVHVASLARTGCDEYFISAPLLDGEQPGFCFERAADALRDRGAEVVSMEVFGIPYARGEGVDALTRVFGPVAWPLTWIDGSPAAPIGGVQLWAIAGPSLRPVMRDGVVAGMRFEDSWATYCRTGGIAPADPRISPGEQTVSLLHALEETVQGAGLEFTDIVRTWFYNRNIAAWYSGFNCARDRFFASRRVFEGLVPASTAVGGGAAGAAALAGGALAIRPKSDLSRSIAARSPLQCPATHYGSAFSRAVETMFPDHARLFVSGTASISRQGHTQHAANVIAQMDRTVDVVGALLESRGYGWGNLASGLAYVKREEDVPAVRRHWERRGIECLPVLIVQADICREELLFELEVNAVLPRNPGAG